MDLELSDDQRELSAVARDLLTRRGGLKSARAFANADADVDAAGLAAEIGELGWYEIGLEADDPFGIPGLCLLAEQIGAHVASTPLVDTAVVARLGAVSRLSGPVALCALEERCGWDLGDVRTRAVPDGHSHRLSGTKLGVHHARLAERLAVVASMEDELVVLLADPSAEGVTLTAAPGLDPSAAATTVEFDSVAVARDDYLEAPHLARAFAVGGVATAAEAVGAASRALEMAASYAGERIQFGRPIGAFQAIQHRLADMHVERETAWSTVLYAAGALDERLEEAPIAASVAKAHATRAIRRVVEGALQVLGGIGFTWEHDLHLLQRRALGCERRFGDALDHERRIAALMNGSTPQGGKQ